MFPIILRRITFLEREPIKAKTIITDVKQNFFCFNIISNAHTALFQFCDLLI